MTRYRHLAFASLAVMGLSAVPARAAFVTFAGTFQGSGMNTALVPGGTLSGSFSFQINYDGANVGLYSHIPGSLVLNLNEDTLGGVTFSTAAGNVGGWVIYNNAAPFRVYVGGTASGLAIASSDLQSDFFVRFQLTSGGILRLNSLAVDNASQQGTFAPISTLSGTTTFEASPTGVPEPASAVLLGIGMVGLAFRSRRRGA